MLQSCANYNFELVLDGLTKLLSVLPPAVQDYVHSIQDNFGFILQELKTAAGTAKYFVDRKCFDEEFKVGQSTSKLTKYQNFQTMHKTRLEEDRTLSNDEKD